MSLSLDIRELNSVLEDFSELTGFRIGIFDLAGSEVAAYPRQFCEFCSKLRENKKADEICMESDKKAFIKASQTRELNIYRCSFGLVEAIAPILDENTLIGFVMIGQMAEKRPDICDYTANPISAFFDRVEYEELLSKVPAADFGRIRSAASIMNICAEYLHLSGKIKKQSYLLSKRLREYIARNFTGAVTVAGICKNLGISKTALYMLSKNEFGMSIIDHINCKRLEYSKKLLSDTDYSIREIAERSGFNDQNYFTRLFKKINKLTPTEYRLKQKSN